MLVRSIPALDRFAPEQLKKLWIKLKIPKEFCCKTFHFGYDQAVNKFRGFLYNSERSFESEELESNVLWTLPFIRDFHEGDDIFENLKRIVSLQREEELSQPQKRRSGIGGDIHIVVLEHGRTTILNYHRFEDFEEPYSKMCEELATNKARS